PKKDSAKTTSEEKGSDPNFTADLNCTAELESEHAFSKSVVAEPALRRKPSFSFGETGSDPKFAADPNFADRAFAVLRETGSDPDFTVLRKTGSDPNFGSALIGKGISARRCGARSRRGSSGARIAAAPS